VVTGVAAGRGTAEVWLLNTATNESRTVTVGETFLDLVLVSANGGAAVFQAGEERFRIVIGNRLTDRPPAP
jgi:hypothetical protein